ncbi:MAG: 4-alpha-glucanotransferase [Eubacteriales bacterium]|nr:4-alpha-glucanotransferase [Eubacteriales bacterium]
MLKKRGAGALLHISSLPSPYGVGVFDENARHFVDKLAEMGFTYWQVLPLCPIDGSGSPYCSTSAFAGNYIFIDPRGLADMGLIGKQDIRSNIYDGTPYTADYDFAKENRLNLLKKAFFNINDNIAKEIKEFEISNPWLTDYAVYMAVKESEGGKPWWEWRDNHAHYFECIKNIFDYEESAAFWKFVQFIFYKQWQELKEYANSKGIAIIGDMPIYVAMDSVDVWSNMPMFLIDEKTLKVEKVAGVPPDYFSEDGQLWGNPIYDWSAMKNDGYSWWLTRLGHALSIYDTVRIDHFRAFASYWAVPADSDTAKVGQWIEGPGMDLFDAVFRKFGKDAPIIAEDLGVFGEDVVQLLEDTGFPGMKVAQFGFDPNGDSSHLPHNAEKNSINYVGTHDNNTILGWLWEATAKEREFALEYCHFEGDNWGEGGYYSRSCRAITEAVWQSASNVAIIALQDMCGFGSDARMNTPGVAEKNWQFRTTKDTIDSIDTDYFRHINSLYRRMYPSIDNE